MEKTYKVKDLATILRGMADYIDDDCDSNDAAEYFAEIVETGLFHDAHGKIVRQTDCTVTVAEEY